MNANGIDADEPAPASGAHTGQNRLTTDKGSFDGVIDLRLPRLPGRFAEVLLRYWGRVVVDENVNATEPGLRLKHNGGDLLCIRDIRLDKKRFTALRRQVVKNRLRVAFILNLIDDDTRAFACKHPCNARPCTSRGTGDECDFAL